MTTKTSEIEDIFGELTFEYKPVKKTLLKHLPRIDCAQTLFNYIFKEYSSFIYEKEVLYAIYINKSNRVLGRWKASIGSTEATIIPIKEIITRALLLNASAFFIVHNHPSGGLTPSMADIKIAKKLQHAAILLDLKLLDSLIISPDGDYYSLTSNGDL